MYIDQLDNIANKYNNAYHNTIKVKPVHVKISHILTLLSKLMTKILNLELVILLEYQNKKKFFPKSVVINGAIWDDLDKIFQTFNH